MFPKIAGAIIVLLALMYGLYKYGGDYRYLEDGDAVYNYESETHFNIPYESGRTDGPWLLIDRPDDIGVDKINIADAPRDKLQHARNCGRMKVRFDSLRTAYFEGSGCFIDW